MSYNNFVAKKICRRRQLSFFCILILMLLLSNRELTAAQSEKIAQTAAIYQSFPKGVVLESVATGFPVPRNNLDYDKATNALVINREVNYVLPIPKDQFLRLAEALFKDDRVGVSIPSDRVPVIYGALTRKDDPINQALINADMLLFGIMTGNPQLMGNVKLPQDYIPRRARDDSSEPYLIAGMYNFTNFQFTRVDDNITRRTFQLDIHIVPVTRGKARDGGHDVDFDRLESGNFYAEEQKSNAAHITEFQDDYITNIPILTTAAKYGEAAAVIRLLRDNKVNLRQLARILR